MTRPDMHSITIFYLGRRLSAARLRRLPVESWPYQACVEAVRWAIRLIPTRPSFIGRNADIDALPEDMGRNERRAANVERRRARKVKMELPFLRLLDGVELPEGFTAHTWRTGRSRFIGTLTAL